MHYTSALEARRASLAAASREHIAYGNLRVVVLVAGLVAAFLARSHVSAWWWLVPLAAFIWVGGRLERAIRTKTRLARAVAFYERAQARLDGQWAAAGGDTGDRFLDADHLYARDLDLFGYASLFQLLTSARTQIGAQTLAAWLKAPAAPEVVLARQEAVRDLAPRVGLREDLAVLGEDAPSSGHTAALATWGERPASFRAVNTPVWAWLFSFAGVLAIAGVLVWIASKFGALLLSDRTSAALWLYIDTVYVLGWLVILRFRTRTSRILDDVEAAARDLGLLAGVLGRLEAEPFTSARLRTLRAALDAEGEPPSRRIARLDQIMSIVDSGHHLIIRLLRPLLLWDVHLAYAVERWRRSSGRAVRRWLDAVGEMEALSSFAGYAFEHPDDVFPDLDAGAPAFDGEGLGHPLLLDPAIVRNDVHIVEPLRVLVVSGSNMSGKSTLLRTVGVNAVLAQAGGPVRAHRLRLTPLVIGASVHVEDSLQSGVSRFYAEVLRIGHIMQRAGDTAVLFLLDELLHGTNSHDRRIGAEAIVRGLVDHGAIGLVTTHDLALAQVADALAPRGANVHFQDTLENGRMHFDYRMRPGVVQKSNALELMRSVGLQV